MALLRQFPALVILMLMASLLMLAPATLAAVNHNWLVARAFFYEGVFFSIIAIILGIATMSRRPRVPARYHLMTLLMSYILLPVVLAAPLYEITPTTQFRDVYFEMLSCLTTTGATIFDRPRLLPDAVHLWRALVGWLGGLMVLVTAFGVLAPLNLGGFEISQRAWDARAARGAHSIEEASRRILAQSRVIAPVYIGATAALWVLLSMLGDHPFVALCHAMATLATSGISPIGGLEGAGSGRAGEFVIAIFLLFAISHRGLNMNLLRGRPPDLRNPQIQLMLICVIGVTVVLFMRSFLGAVEIDRPGNVAAAAQAVWGSVFTVLSFLTTTGFESHDWRAMQIWSGLPDPGAILLGLAVMGGGIATTAGGIKLLRIYALYRHGLREMDLLVHPSSVGHHGQGDQVISERGPQIAFVFLMLFLTALAAMMILYSAAGLNCDRSLALAVAALTTTGPVIRTLGEGFGYGDLNAVSQAIFCVGMIVGRMEPLVIIALFNPAFWRA
jgi:trk system potassium uptake protein TrkH